MECAQCGVSVPAGQGVCKACGTPFTRSEAVAPQDEIAGLLAEVTLLRTWGQYEEAINMCTRILRMDPRNAPAHSLLGDLYRDQGNHHEALGWYKLAVQLNPTSDSDRRKLDEMIDRVFQGASRGMVSAPGFTIGQPSTPPKAAAPPRLQALLNKLQPVHVVIGCTVIAITVMMIIAFNITGHSSAPKSSTRAPQQMVPPPSTAPHFPTTQPATSSATNQQTPLFVTPPPADTTEGGESIPGLPGVQVITGNPKPPAPPAPGQPSLQPRGNAPSATAEVPPFTPPPAIQPGGGPVDDQHTAAIKAAMEKAAKESKMAFSLDKVMVDPRTGNIMAEYSLPNMGGLTQTKQGLIYAGYRLVWAAMPQSPTSQLFTLRGFAYTDGNRQASLALAADVTPNQAEAARYANDYNTVLGFLTNPWWRSDLANAPL